MLWPLWNVPSRGSDFGDPSTNRRAADFFKETGPEFFQNSGCRRLGMDADSCRDLQIMADFRLLGRAFTDPVMWVAPG